MPHNDVGHWNQVYTCRCVYVYVYVLHACIYVYIYIYMYVCICHRPSKERQILWQDPSWKGAQKMMNQPEKFLLNLKGPPGTVDDGNPA